MLFFNYNPISSLSLLFLFVITPQHSFSLVVLLVCRTQSGHQLCSLLNKGKVLECGRTVCHCLYIYGQGCVCVLVQ